MDAPEMLAAALERVARVSARLERNHVTPIGCMCGYPVERCTNEGIREYGRSAHDLQADCVTMVLRGTLASIS